MAAACTISEHLDACETDEDGEAASMCALCEFFPAFFSCSSLAIPRHEM